MHSAVFHTPSNDIVPAVTTAEMRAVDRIAVEDIGLDIARMMEHAGRGLAEAVLEVVTEESITVVAGAGGNGGGGLACARHLANRGLEVRVVLDRDADAIEGATEQQLRVLEAMDVPISTSPTPALDGLVVDALVGYGLRDAPHGRVEELISAMADADGATVSLDVPSGCDATSGHCPGIAVDPDTTVTLALPKTGLAHLRGSLVLADISIPATVYERVGIAYRDPFGRGFSVELRAG